MPGETEDQIKQPDTPLGADAYKRVWPKSVWPGAIPSSVPLSLRADFLARTFSLVPSHGAEDEGDHEGDDHGKKTGDDDHDESSERLLVRNDFQFPSELALLAAGTAGGHVSYNISLELTEEAEVGDDGTVDSHTEVDIHRASLRFNSILGPDGALNIKIGDFDTELVNTFSPHRRLTIANYDSMFSYDPIAAEVSGGLGGHGHGGGAFGLPNAGIGLEAYGIASHRLLWSLGVVNGIGPGDSTSDANDRKDVSGRLSYKFGGMALDGSNAATYTTSEKNWREKSLRVGVFAYTGDGRDIGFPVTSDEEEFLLANESFERLGFDFNWFIGDFNIFGAVVRGEDQLVLLGGHGDEEEPDEHDDDHGIAKSADSLAGEFEYTSWFVEADAVLHYPWLHGAVRYETVDLPHEDEKDWERGTISLTALVRANVKSTLEYTRDLNESRNYFFGVRFGIVF
jgi:hypothetical protein